MYTFTVASSLKTKIEELLLMILFTALTEYLIKITYHPENGFSI